MNQQLVSRSPRRQQFLQDIRIAWRMQRIWLVSCSIFIFSLLLIAGILSILGFFLPIVFSFLLHIVSSIQDVVVSFAGVVLLFLCLLLLMLLTARRQAINAYRKTVHNSFRQSMKSYYPPTNAPRLSEEQDQHLLLLGLPGSGKTKSLENYLYQVTRTVWRNNDKIPVLIQMKYYDGFFRQHLLDSSPDLQRTSSTETLFSYISDDKHKQSSQAPKELELVGMQHLRPYLQQLIGQGRVVFLCDGMNELGSNALQTVHGELTGIMRTQNRVIMTCRELEYQEQILLQDFAYQGATKKTLPALSEEDVPHIVERYLQSQVAFQKGKRRKSAMSNQQILQKQQRIQDINKPHRYTSPFMLIMLIQALEKLDPGQTQTIPRGRLLQISVDQRLTGEDAQMVRRFLSVVACTARRNEQRNAIQLSSNKKRIPLTEFSEDLNDWLKDNEAENSNFTSSDIRKLLDIAQRVGLITISNYGVLSFMHELIAEYFAAEYLSYIYHEKSESESFWASLYESETKAAGIWSEPVALWAGLEERPMEVATFLIKWAEDYNGQHETNDGIYYHALALSLACIGVKAPDALPQSIQKYLEKFVRGAAERAKLAKIFKRCADEGGSEVYEALLPLIDVKGLPDLFLELHELHSESNDSIIPNLLLDYLEKVAIQIVYDDQTRILVGVLGELGKRRFGDRVRERARSLSEASIPIPLRLAAIGILGLIKNAGDVQLLISYLHDPSKEKPVAGAAIDALIAFGPEFALIAIANEEKNLHSPAHAQIRLNLLLVLQGFLKLEFIPSKGYKLIISTTIEFLSSFDAPKTQFAARSLLDEQLQQSKQHAAIIAEWLLRAIATTDEKQAGHIQWLLQENCPAIFDNIKSYWERYAPIEQARIRIIEVLGKVSDKPEVPDGPILTFLLRQLDDPAANAQTALCHALSLHQPASIHPLLLTVLSRNTTDNATNLAVITLKEIGASSVAPICKEISNIQSHTNISERGLCLLVRLLDYFGENKLIPDTKSKDVVNTLIALLGWPETALDKVYEEAITCLSNLGELDINITFNYLINSLDSVQETLTTQRVRKVLVRMKHFPYDKLLSTFKHPRDTVVHQVRQVFVDNQQVPQTAPFLVNHLFDNDKHISGNVKQTIKSMQPKITMPHLVRALSKEGWKDVIEPLLLDCPEPAVAITLLVEKLGEVQLRVPAGSVLLDSFLKFGPQLLPWILPGLQNTNARTYTRGLIVQMVDLYQQNSKKNLLPNVVNLFEFAATRLEVRAVLRDLLTQELANSSLPALIDGLQKPSLREDCCSSLVTLVSLPDRQDEVLQEVLKALRNPHMRQGAHNTLVRCGQLTVKPVYGLLWDDDNTIIDEARSILAEMGEIAFPFIYKLAHDSQRISDAKIIFMRMSGSMAASSLLPYLYPSNTDIQQVEMAFYLLSIRIENEYLLGKFDMTLAMLQKALEQPDSDVRLRVLTLLLFFNSNTQTQQRKKIAEHIVNTIKSSPEYHAEFMRILPLLGNQAIEPLANVVSLDRGRVPPKVYLDAVGTLGMLEAHPRLTDYVKDLARSTQGSKTMDLNVQAQGLRAFGGLLASGIYDWEELNKLQNISKRENDLTSFEFYDVLLGQRNMPEIAELNNTIVELRGKMQQYKSTIAGLETKVQQKNSTIVELRGKIQQHESSIAGLWEQIRQHESTIAGLRGQIQQRDNTIQTQNNTIATLSERISHLQT